MPVQVSFDHPSETDLVFYYIQKQMEAFDADGIRRPQYKVLVGESEIIVELDYPDQGGAAGLLGPAKDGTESD